MSKNVTLWAARDENEGPRPETIVFGLHEPTFNMGGWAWPQASIVLAFQANEYDFTIEKGHKAKVRVDFSLIEE